MSEESVKEFEDIPGTKLYLVTKGPENQLFGIFSDRKILMKALQFSGLDGCFIKGESRNKKVSGNTIAEDCVHNRKTCKIWNEKGLAYRIGFYETDHINPKFLHAASVLPETSVPQNKEEKKQLSVGSYKIQELQLE